MCMNKAKKINAKKLPKYGYKLLYNDASELATICKRQKILKHKWNKADSKKDPKNEIEECRIHKGRISVYGNKRDAMCSIFSFDEIWKVELKLTSKYAYKGKFSKATTYAVDEIKLIENVGMIKN